MSDDQPKLGSSSGRLGQHSVSPAQPTHRKITEGLSRFFGYESASGSGHGENPMAFSDAHTTEYLRYRIKKIGKPPGSLVHFGRIATGKVKISIIEYGPDHFQEKENATLQDCLDAPLTSNVTWIHINGIHDTALVEALGKRFHLHFLMMEDIVNATQRSKLDVYADNLFFFLKLIFYPKEKNDFVEEQISLVLGDRYLISFLEEDRDIFSHVRERVRSDKSPMRQLGPDYLCYTLLDSLVDQYFVVLENVDERVEAIERELMKGSKPSTLFKIQHLKQDILVLKRSIWPMREVVNSFRHVENPFISSNTKLFLNDVYDHTIQLIETVDSFREITSGLLEVYISNINYRMNEIMKFLTMVSTLFVPLTFIASIYGMNFKYMPELEWIWGYYFTLGIMVIVALCMLTFFRIRRWL